MTTLKKVQHTRCAMLQPSGSGHAPVTAPPVRTLVCPPSQPDVTPSCLWGTCICIDREYLSSRNSVPCFPLFFFSNDNFLLFLARRALCTITLITTPTDEGLVDLGCAMQRASSRPPPTLYLRSLAIVAGNDARLSASRRQTYTLLFEVKRMGILEPYTSGYIVKKKLVHTHEHSRTKHKPQNYFHLHGWVQSVYVHPLLYRCLKTQSGGGCGLLTRACLRFDPWPWPLTLTKRVTSSSSSPDPHVLQVDVREYYTDKATGEYRPGYKGVTLNPSQWEALKDAAGAVDAMVDAIK